MLFLCNLNRALREICKATPRMRAQISRSDALKIGYKVMNKHPKSLFIKEVLHMIYFQHVCWLVAHFFKTKRVKNKRYKSGIGDNLVVITFAFYMLFIERLSNGEYGTTIIKRRYVRYRINDVYAYMNSINIASIILNSTCYPRHPNLKQRTVCLLVKLHYKN